MEPGFLEKTALKGGLPEMRNVPTAIIASSLLIALLQGCASPAAWRTDSKNPPPTVHKVKTMKKSHHRRAASSVSATRSTPSTTSNLPDLNIYGRGGGSGGGAQVEVVAAAQVGVDGSGVICSALDVAAQPMSCR